MLGDHQNKFQGNPTIWDNMKEIEGILLSDISGKEKNVLYDISLIYGIYKNQLTH